MLRRAHIVSVLALALAGSACNGSASGGKAYEGGVAPFFLPTGEPTNTSAPRVEVDAEGGIHAVYPAYAGGQSFYAYCAADCAGPEAVSVVPFDTDGTTANAMLALDGEGRPHVLLSTFQSVYYAEPSGDPKDPGSWSVARIVEHGGEREVTGEALALDRDGHPRFMMHTYVAYLGIGQGAPETYFVGCDADCFDPGSWTSSKVADQIWEGSALRIDAAGTAHLATVAHVVNEDQSTTKMGAYLACTSSCESPDAWVGTGLMPAFDSDLEAVSIEPAIALALTAGGAPRVALLAKAEDGAKNVMYFECDEGCTTADSDTWRGTILSDMAEIGAGIDLALDAAGSPRLAYTLDYNIGVFHCDGADCTSETAPWDLAKVEAGAEMDPDEIFLYDNCDVGAWFLHSPSIALAPDGSPRVGYQARDISGGWDNPDPYHLADCVAGTDMTWSRLAVMGSL